MSGTEALADEFGNIAPDEKIAFKNVEGPALNLHVFHPTGDGVRGNRVDGDRLPCIVFFFGGGWSGGTPRQFFPHSRYLSSRGMVAISAEYRTETSHGTTPYECVSDGKSAIRWIRANANDLGVDTRRIVAGGGSAGGHVAAACAAVTAFDAETDDLSISAVPAALVLFNPAFDNGPEGWGHDRVSERWREISPFHNLSEGHPPVVVFFGTEDTLVPVSKAEAYRDKVEAFGSRCDLFLYPGQPHAFFNYRGGSNPYYDATVYEADRFLESLGYLTGEPRIAKPNVDVMGRGAGPLGDLDSIR